MKEKYQVKEDNLTLFLRGCEELGLKGSQLFDPGDLQDTSTRTNHKGFESSRKLKNVLITIYWLGRAANSCATYSGPTLDLREFEGLLSQMRKEAEDWDSPKRSIRDSGYIDCWESERSDSLSPPRHGRDDSFDSLDSLGSRSRHTPSPDVLVARGNSDGRGSDSESDVPHRRIPDVRKDDMLARRTSCSEPRTAMPFNQFLPNKSNQTAYMPTPLRRKRTEREDSRKSWSNASSPIGGERPFRFSHRASMCDYSESVSMSDVRYEEDSTLPPHSQVRHELMHNQYIRMKEEEDHWQDDLARWKSRRRSMSQDLIKKEEERKMMERLMTGDGGGGSQRRKSIKTYREIVEEKERRERELHEAYRRARTPEEAASILHRYAQRFTISEAVLECLKLPKLLERSVSADPTATSSAHFSSEAPLSPTSSNPMQYLRQQSLPVPKFTSTMEARVSGFIEERIETRSPDSPPARGLSPKTAPLLSPKPYSQSRTTSTCLSTAKVEDTLRVNGETGNDINSNEVELKREKERESEADSSDLCFFPSPSRPSDSETTDTPEREASPSDTHTPECWMRLSEVKEVMARSDKAESEYQSPAPVSDSQRESTQQRQSASLPAALPQELQSEGEAVPQEEGQVTKGASDHTPPTGHSQPPVGQAETSSSVIQNANTLTQDDVSATQISTLGLETSKKAVGDQNIEESPRTEPGSGPSSTEGGQKEHENVSPAVLNLLKRGEPFAWDPEEERKRQERWQHEQERMLQEKYQREQEKLKQEWERAQREVEEEERRYHEEERKILEETVAPLTPHSPIPLSPHQAATAPSTSTPNTHPESTTVPSLTDWEHKQEVLEKQTMGNSKDLRQRENNRNEATEMKNKNLQTKASTPLLGSSQKGGISAGQSNGQKGPEEPNQNSRPAPYPSHDVLWGSNQQQSEALKKTASLDCNRNPQLTPTAGQQRRRSGSVENVGPKSLKSSSYSSDTQPPSPNRSVSGKKLCSSCGHPLGKGAAMIIETLSLYFHIQCFKCGICKGQLGDTTTGTDVRIRNGLLNCHQCYIRSRSAGQPTTL
ncbi:LIM and calponin homology domains-containing protein 1 isoform X2 [Chanos chanos]|uniref:LIM and calponin homology domains-containing protein 1 isoform X2 n=1 Tax=Chanos chanos TaxID=29144 RepID=A0A6J2VIX5_CHACN|nr:LIM and calponin homology domains-containing protein 1-like isoform X2 [Chanos chanos]